MKNIKIEGNWEKQSNAKHEKGYRYALLGMIHWSFCFYSKWPFYGPPVWLYKAETFGKIPPDLWKFNKLLPVQYLEKGKKPSKSRVNKAVG